MSAHTGLESLQSVRVTGRRVSSSATNADTTAV